VSGIRRYILLGLLASAAACSSGPDLGPDALVVIGTIQGMPSQTLVVTPAPLVAGQATQVIVNSFGSSSCTEPDHATVTQDSMEATVTPYDRVAPAGTRCAIDVAPQPHPIALRYASAGTATLHVVGYRLNATTGVRLDTVTVSLTVTGGQ
jgi:hypothetical protein